MGTPSEEALAAARALLAEQAQTVTGDPAAAGIFGDTAGASQPPVPIDLGPAKATEVDPAELLARLQAQQAQIDALLAAAKAAEPPPPEPPDVTPRLSNASGEMQQAFHYLHLRLAQVEAKLGLDAAAILHDLA